MKLPSALALLSLVSFCPIGVVSAADLTQVPRTIGKQPAYQSQSPTYGLIVFGPKADRRVWVVLDGAVLYVDANGNGDLTDAGERIELKNKNHEPSGLDEVALAMADGEKLSVWVWGWFDFQNGKKNTLEPSLSVKWKGRTYGAWGDQNSGVIFAGRPENVPIFHVGGPLQMGFEVRQEWGVRRIDEKTFELKVGVGTPGLGKGSFVHLKYYEAIPVSVQPTAELEFPNKHPGGPPIRIKQVLKERC